MYTFRSSRCTQNRRADAVIAAAVPIALAVPDGDFRSDEGSVFARALAGAEGQDDFDLVLRHLGRSPDWAPNVVG
ncbi:hypothetical protein [Mycobacteroides abscessus]|uniref:hypothetical protein n=1 Tax=Mycobacteroides abscessus TaxID=36809 RepID=UPI000698984B|nr:hypothetical protein [Mycobacteroides abscessus]